MFWSDLATCNYVQSTTNWLSGNNTLFMSRNHNLPNLPQTRSIKTLWSRLSRTIVGKLQARNLYIGEFIKNFFKFQVCNFVLLYTITFVVIVKFFSRCLFSFHIKLKNVRFSKCKVMSTMDQFSILNHRLTSRFLCYVAHCAFWYRRFLKFFTRFCQSLLFFYGVQL